MHSPRHQLRLHGVLSRFKLLNYKPGHELEVHWIVQAALRASPGEFADDWGLEGKKGALAQGLVHQEELACLSKFPVPAIPEMPDGTDISWLQLEVQQLQPGDRVVVYCKVQPLDESRVWRTATVKNRPMGQESLGKWAVTWEADGSKSTIALVDKKDIRKGGATAVLKYWDSE